MSLPDSNYETNKQKCKKKIKNKTSEKKNDFSKIFPLRKEAQQLEVPVAYIKLWHAKHVNQAVEQFQKCLSKSWAADENNVLQSCMTTHNTTLYGSGYVAMAFSKIVVLSSYTNA